MRSEISQNIPIVYLIHNENKLFGGKNARHIFAKIIYMETTKSTGKYWLYFIISLAAMIVMLVVKPQYFWVLLPLVVTFFAKAMDLM